MFKQVTFSRFAGLALWGVLGSVLLFFSGCQAPMRQAQPVVKAAVPVPKPQIAVPQFSEDVLKLQLFLDGKDFGPGLIDGRKGRFTTKVLEAYESLHGTVAVADFQSIAPYATYKIRNEDLARIGKIAASADQRALQRNQPYTELIAFVAERYHTSRAFLREINPGRNFSQLKAGDSIVVPNVEAPFKLEAYAPAAKTSPDPARKTRSVEVDTQDRLLRVLDSGQTLAVFPITPGSKELPAPLGTWMIRGIAAMPWYRYDKGVLEHGVRTKNFYMLPPGPRSPVGILWAGLNKPGIGIHGTSNPESIGRSASHGCIRLSNWDAARFRDLVTVGNKVTIR